MNNSVPLWAYFVTTAVALFGPLTATWLGNRRSRQAAAEQRSHERSMYLLDKKHELYNEALTVFVRAGIDVLHEDEDHRQEAFEQVRVIVERLRIHAPAEVHARAVAASLAIFEVFKAMDRGETYGKATSELSAKSAHAILLFAQAVGDDMSSEVETPS